MAKKKDVAKKLRAMGYWLEREGAKHEIWTNGGFKSPLPRHREIVEKLANSILKKARENQCGSKDD